MQLSQTTSMRMDQRMLLTPRMIQSMEILQLPLMMLEERIDQELSTNPVLEMRQGSDDPRSKRDEAAEHASDNGADNGTLSIDPDSPDAAEFRRLERIADYLENEEYSSGNNFRRFRGDGERDGKLDAMANTAARGSSLAEHLLDQWRLDEPPDHVRPPGELLIRYIDPRGYLDTPFDAIRYESGKGFSDEQFLEALQWIQKLDPPGIGARSLKECLLLQLKAIEADPDLAEGHDIPLERALLRDHLNDLEQNRYPQISKRLGREIDDIKAAVRRMARFVPHPGKLISVDEAPPITPDATIIFDEDANRYEIEMRRDFSDQIVVPKKFREMAKDRSLDKTTRGFLAEKLRDAKWLKDSLELRRNTLHRVIRVVVDTQQAFFEKGPEMLKPLPMIQVADQLGIHVATVSRAVSEKYIQTPIGIFPLRRFFTTGTTDSDGNEMSWDAVKEKLKKIIDDEDKQNPLNDDELVDKLKVQGIDLARRTVAKYRKLLHIPTARQRKEF